MTKPIYILALHGVRTGGPEAIHQLSDALIEQGFDARLVYYDFRQIALMERAPTQDGYHFGLRDCPYEEYAHYKTKIVANVPNAPDTIVVLPETLCHLAPKFDKATVLIWWLSVDYGFGALSKVNLNHLRKPGVWHAHQSKYAQAFAQSLQFDPYSLSDYTADLTRYAEPLSMDARPWLALFNANHKVIDDVDKLIAEIRDTAPEIDCQKLGGGLSRQEMAALYATARVYVDLGCFPGKDRAPREARLMGCVPVVTRRGAGEETAGWAIKHDWAQYIAMHVQQPSEWALREEPDERAIFFKEVGALFGLMGCDPDGLPYAGNGEQKVRVRSGL